MKKTAYGPRLLASVAISLLAAACADQGPTSVSEDPVGAKQLWLSQQAGDKEIPRAIHNSPISYIAALFDGDVVAGGANFRSAGSPALWDYYSFCAVAGDVPTIEIHRTTSAMDPALTLFFGITDDSDGLSSGGSSQPGMTFLAFRDDNNGIPHGVGGSFADPKLSGFALPSTGLHTLAVFDFVGAGPGPTVPYEIHIDGIGCVRVEMDIKPGSDPNSINPRSMGQIPVAILTTSISDGDAVDFDAGSVDPSTVTFGPGQAAPTHGLSDPGKHREDVDGDGDLDLVLHFDGNQTDIAEGDSQACLAGQTVSGETFFACDDVRVVGATATAIDFAPELGPFSNVVPLGDDQTSGLQPIGFEFAFFGIGYTEFNISSNGFMGFDAGMSNGCCSGRVIPSADGIDNIVAVAWTDLFPPGGGVISYETRGRAPRRRLIVSFEQLGWFPEVGVNRVTAQVILYEQKNLIEIHTTNQSAGRTYTQGVENADGTLAAFLPGRVAANFGLTNDAVRFDTNKRGRNP